ncbi:MAG: RluA family pseudouridine synthase [Opitutae bacterium]|nr:RluA family pseudouridine synthase [Opitutae bacterium]
MEEKWQVEGGVEKMRADKWISRKLPQVSRTHVQKAFQKGLVKINGGRVAKSAKLREGDVVEFSGLEVERRELSPVDLPLHVLFEDEHLLVLNKASGMVVHPGAGTHDQTLVHALLFHYRGRLSALGGADRPGIVHRLDRDTSGVMVVAKSDAAHRGLSAAFAARSVGKTYLALVAGVPERLSGALRKPMGRHPVHRYKMSIRPDGKSAHTDWQFVESSRDRISLLRCDIHTGRTHQIRLHLADMGHPILGDKVYGYRGPGRDLPVEPARVMLHAWRLELVHPLTRQRLRLVAQPPDDFRDLYPGLEPLLKTL